MNMRVGIGYDVHRLEVGRRLVLGGVEVPSDRGLSGWSDADVALHAIIDALLGAAALGDIGTYFPSGDARYRDVSGLDLLRETAEILRGRSRDIGNIDVTIVAREPKLAPFIGEMKRRIGEALSLEEDRVGIKAKTANGVGPAGAGECIEACAVALVRDADEDL